MDGNENFICNPIHQLMGTCDGQKDKHIRLIKKNLYRKAFLLTLVELKQAYNNSRNLFVEIT